MQTTCKKAIARKWSERASHSVSRIEKRAVPAPFLFFLHKTGPVKLVPLCLLYDISHLNEINRLADFRLFLHTTSKHTTIS